MASPAGPDGNLWFTLVDSAGNRVGRIVTSDAVGITTFSAPTPGADFPTGIGVGPDSHPRYAPSYGATRLGRITNAGTLLTPITVPDGYGSACGGLGHRSRRQHVARRDQREQIARITPAGTVTEYPTNSVQAAPGALIVGPDSNRWFTEGIGLIACLDLTTFQVYEFPPSEQRVHLLAGRHHRGSRLQPLAHRVP